MAALFESRVRDLARRSGLKVAESSHARAMLVFNCSFAKQSLWIVPFSGGLWEFSSISALATDNPSTFPKIILISVLQQNATNRRGFWCIEQLGPKHVLGYMQNFPENLLTPDEFNRICWEVVKKVDELERAFSETFM